MIEATPPLPKGENLPNPTDGWCKSMHLLLKVQRHDWATDAAWLAAKSAVGAA